jgi:hypothetical protein
MAQIAADELDVALERIGVAQARLGCVAHRPH